MKEDIEHIKAVQWDKGWRYGLLAGITISLLCIIVAICLI